MKKQILVLLASAIVCTAVSQPYRVRQIGLSNVQREKMERARVAGELIPGFPSAYYSSTLDYESVSIQVSVAGRETSVEGPGDVLNLQHKMALAMADPGSEIVIILRFTYKDHSMDSVGSYNKVKEMKFTILNPQPEKEAEFPGGDRKLDQFMDQEVAGRIDVSTLQGRRPMEMSFLVNEDGEVVQAKILTHGPDETADQLLLSAARKMPRWHPAEDGAGRKVRQQVRVRVPGSKNAVGGGC